MDSGLPSHASRESVPLLNGEVIFESLHQNINKKSIKIAVRRHVEQKLRRLPASPARGSYFVIFSPGQKYDEIRCQVDVDFGGHRTGCGVGVDSHPYHAFCKAMEGLRWHEKGAQLKIEG